MRTDCKHEQYYVDDVVRTNQQTCDQLNWYFSNT